MSIQSFCGCKQNSTASHFHYEKKINTMPSQKTHLLCDLRSDASDNKQSLDMSRIETRTHDNFITGHSSYISLCQTLYVAKNTLSFTKSSRTSEVKHRKGLNPQPTVWSFIHNTYSFAKCQRDVAVWDQARDFRKKTWEVIWFFKCISKDKWSVPDFTSLNTIIAGLSKAPTAEERQ